mgnify:CR=1 FL=1
MSTHAPVKNESAAADAHTTPTADAAERRYDVAVIGGGPAGATAAHELARRGLSVFLLDRPGRIKPCGGAVPPRLIRDFGVPDELIVARAKSARIVAPSERVVDMPIDGGYVGMVDRDVFDEWLRDRAALAGAERRNGRFDRLEYVDGDGEVTEIKGVGKRGNERTGGSGARSGARIHFTAAGSNSAETIFAHTVVAADGANSRIAKQCVPGSEKGVFVAAYHEIVEAPTDPDFDPARCDIHYRGDLSPDFYSWVFPHGKVISIGTGTAIKGFPIRRSIDALRKLTGLTGRTIRREGAPIPLKPLPRWEDGRCVVLAGDAAGVVAPASGEGIYYAMVGGQFAAEAAAEHVATGNARVLRKARKQFMKAHGRVFWVLGIMQKFWYSSDKRRERFVSMCDDPDVQQLTWDAYMNKELVRAKPVAHVKIFFKDLGHLFGLVKA